MGAVVLVFPNSLTIPTPLARQQTWEMSTTKNFFTQKLLPQKREIATQLNYQEDSVPDSFYRTFKKNCFVYGMSQ